MRKKKKNSIKRLLEIWLKLQGNIVYVRATANHSAVKKILVPLLFLSYSALLCSEVQYRHIHSREFSLWKAKNEKIFLVHLSHILLSPHCCLALPWSIISANDSASLIRIFNRGLVMCLARQVPMRSRPPKRPRLHYLFRQRPLGPTDAEKRRRRSLLVGAGRLDVGTIGQVVHQCPSRPISWCMSVTDRV